MLTKAQIQRIAQRNGIGMQVQERDYVQHLLLWLYYSRSQDLVYKGGTALRMVYGGNRYSEDLDFNGPRDVPVLRSSWQEIIARLRDFGITAEMRREWESDVGYSFDVSFQGPLFDGRDRSKGKVRVNVNRRPEEVAARRELVTSEYDDVRPFVVTVLTQEHLLAEKIRALRQSHEKDILPLRTQLFTNRAEMRLLWMETDPDSEKIKAKQKEIHKLQGQLQEKNMDFRFAVSDILTPEQRSKLLQKRFGRHAGPHWDNRGGQGRSQGQYPGMGMGPGQGL